MNILGLEVNIPEQFSVQRTDASDGRVCIDAEGSGADALAASLERLALDAGFRRAKSEPGRVELERGEQLLILVHDDQGLTVQVTDPSLMEQAKHEGSVIVLGDFKADLGTASIEPLREKYNEDKHLRSASWKVGGSAPATLVATVIAQAVESRRLTRGPSFEPPSGGIQSWTGEAYSDAELIKVRATLESGTVTLEVDFVERGRSPT
jgi:hypothetical protein